MNVESLLHVWSLLRHLLEMDERLQFAPSKVVVMLAFGMLVDGVLPLSKKTAV